MIGFSLEAELHGHLHQPVKQDGSHEWIEMLLLGCEVIFLDLVELLLLNEVLYGRFIKYADIVVWLEGLGLANILARKVAARASPAIHAIFFLLGTTELQNLIQDLIALASVIYLATLNMIFFKILLIIDPFLTPESLLQLAHGQDRLIDT